MVDHTNPTDTELVKRARGGDSDAFGLLVERHEANVYGLCIKMLRNPEDAEDCLQEVFVKAYKALPSFREEARFSTWPGSTSSTPPTRPRFSGSCRGSFSGCL